MVAATATAAVKAAAAGGKAAAAAATAVEKAVLLPEGAGKAAPVTLAAGTAKVVEETARYPQAKPWKYTPLRSKFL